jgi:type IV pilus assembly protein PilQ
MKQSASTRTGYRRGGVHPAPLLALILIPLLGAVSACKDTPETKKEPFFKEWRVKAGEARGQSPTDTVFSPQLIPAPTDQTADQPPAGVEAAGADAEGAVTDTAQPQAPLDAAAGLPDQKISLKMHNVDVAVLLRALARAAGVNILINSSVQGKASIQIDQAPWNKVFLGILKTNGLAWEKEGDIIRVISLDDLTASAKLIEADQALSIARQEYDLKVNALRQQARQVEPLQTFIYHVKYSNTATLRDKLESILVSARQLAEAEAGGDDASAAAVDTREKVLMDEHTNSLVVHATEQNVTLLRQIVEKLDRPTPQVLIESQIVEANKSTARALGVQWGGLYYNASGRNNNWVTPGSNSTGTLGDPMFQDPNAAFNSGASNSRYTRANPTSGNVINLPINPVFGDPTMTVGFLTQVLGQNLLNVQLQALQDDGELNILATPSITTLDNQEAEIESGQEIPYQTVENGEVKIEFKKAVLSLKVKPYVIDQETLKLEIEVTKDELDFASGTVGGNPILLTKKATSTVVVYDGQTTVIGGLTKQSTTKADAGVPGLQNIPVLGYLFKNTGKEKRLEDLLIFITPHILKSRPGAPGAASEPAAAGAAGQ